jgi:Flp pilus assembly protein TadB
MSKRPKKRNKRYSGEDAKQSKPVATNEPVIHRYEAVSRSRAGEWWQTKKRLYRIIAIVLVVVLVVAWLLVELIRTVF